MAKIKRIIPVHEASKRKAEARKALLAYLHRPPSPVCGDHIQEQVEAARERMKRPKAEKADYTPPRTEDWQTAYHVGTVARRITHTGLEKQRKHVSCQSKGTHKGYGKGGVKLINIITRAAYNRQKFQDDLNYAS